jgi:N-hydroxyarylamine O-acetyltransferase
MDTESYLTRINYDGKLDPSFAVLSTLQEKHLLSVPFENLDIHTGKSIVLDPELLFQKIVTMRRGGFCYELNTLFYLLLLEFGFQATLVSGKVYDHSRSDYGPEFDHMLMLVNIEKETWLADVGFGDFAMHPLKFELNQALVDTNGQFLIERENGKRFRVSRFSASEERYIPEYIFSTTERRIGDFGEMCSYHQTSPASHFTQKRVCSIATTTGRITLTDEKLIITGKGGKNEFQIRDEEMFRRALLQYFNINVSAR